ncbi:MAG: Lrp/AsnC family transcriptional regulator [Dehalococcoidia bacterium]|nr:Lrp/AsnC family transcriptional regulator [Dehalococcoidia bacterium]
MARHPRASAPRRYDRAERDQHSERPGEMIKAYVLIVTDPGATARVTKALGNVRGVTEVHDVMGPYDIVAELVTDNLDQVGPILLDQIRALAGIRSTTSLVVFPERDSD